MNRISPLPPSGPPFSEAQIPQFPPRPEGPPQGPRDGDGSPGEWNENGGEGWPQPARVRTLFLSDIHLGTRGCQADMLLDFLARHRAQRIYLVGDIFDGWRLRRGWHWPQSHNNVVEALLTQAQAGTPIVYIPGNHDEVMRSYYGTHFGGIEVKAQDVHITADGRRLLVIHGDQFDVVVKNAKWLAHVGDRAYAMVLGLSTVINRIRRLWDGQFWSLSAWAKGQVKQAVNFIGEYETVLADEAVRGGYDGIVCGHIHKAALSRIGEVAYANCGDWVESCTAVVEDDDGRLRLVDWAGVTREARSHARRAAAALPAASELASQPAASGPGGRHAEGSAGSRQ